MSNSNFDKNVIDASEINRLKYPGFVVIAFAIYFNWAFFNDASFHHLAENI